MTGYIALARNWSVKRLRAYPVVAVVSTVACSVQRCLMLHTRKTMLHPFAASCFRQGGHLGGAVGMWPRCLPNRVAFAPQEGHRESGLSSEEVVQGGGHLGSAVGMWPRFLPTASLSGKRAQLRRSSPAG